MSSLYTSLLSRGLGLALAALCAARLLSGCGGQGLAVAAPSAAGGVLPAPVLFAIDGQLRAASGPPAGIHLSWSRVGDPGVQGYYLYRDSQPIVVPPPHLTLDPALRTNGGNLVPQPPIGPDVPFDDLFTPVVGTTYYYRVTTVDLNGDESYPSNEITYTVQGQQITDIAPTSLRIGDALTITGTAFGAFNAPTDSVQFPGALGGSVAAAITSWLPGQIIVTVPPGVRSGPIGVLVGGYFAQSAQSLTILSPVITSVSPGSAFVGEQVLVSGSGFGTGQGGSTLRLAGDNVSGAVDSWSDTTIELTLPADALPGDFVVHVGAEDSNPAPFSPRAEILAISPDAAADGSTVLISGRHFGMGFGTVTASGAATVNVLGWSNASISVEVTGPAAAYNLTVVPAAGLPSNPFRYEILGPLAITLDSIADGDVLRASAPPVIEISTATDAMLVELLLDGNVVASSNAAPFTSLSLPLTTTLNGTYTLQARAQRGSETAVSVLITVQVVSLEGDVNADGTVDALDSTALAPLLGLDATGAQFRAWFDTNNDGFVTEADQSRIGYNFGLSL